jgi:hypothetical protein
VFRNETLCGVYGGGKADGRAITHAFYWQSLPEVILTMNLTNKETTGARPSSRMNAIHDQIKASRFTWYVLLMRKADIVLSSPLIRQIRIISARISGKGGHDEALEFAGQMSGLRGERSQAQPHLRLILPLAW